jgi:hypothetical protein
MASAWVRNPTSGQIVCVDAIDGINAVLNNDNVTYSYTLFKSGQTQPFYLSSATFPDPLSATIAAYEALVIELT